MHATALARISYTFFAGIIIIIVSEWLSFSVADADEMRHQYVLLLHCHQFQRDPFSTILVE